jgi:sugar phosphate isomerase/epimerase
MQTGLNPYGIAYTVGLQASDSPRANPRPIGVDGFVRLAHEIGVRVIELDWRWLTRLTDGELARLRDDLAGATPIVSAWLLHEPGETLADVFHCAAALGAATVRMHLTPVVEGGRAALGERWHAMVAHARETLRREARRAADHGLVLAVENHQDFGSAELLSLTAAAGDNVAIVLDTGNPFSVGEDPVAFARRVASRVRHVHLKDYRAQFTDAGFRLVRCAIDDGAVPFEEIAAVLPAGLTASIEIGALDARHIRLFEESWWRGYSPPPASELAVAIGRLQRHRFGRDDDHRTPWEKGSAAAAIVDYEMRQLRRSVAALRARGWLPITPPPTPPQSAP